MEYYYCANIPGSSGGVPGSEVVVGCGDKVSEDCLGEVVPAEFEMHSSDDCVGAIENCVDEVWITDGCEHGMGTTESCED